MEVFPNTAGDVQSSSEIKGKILATPSTSGKMPAPTTGLYLSGIWYKDGD